MLKRFLDTDIKEIRICSRGREKQDDMRHRFQSPKIKFYIGDVRDIRWAMTDKLQYKGYWHLPDKPEETVAGELTYIPKESICLELIGSFDQGKNSIAAFLTITIVR